MISMKTWRWMLTLVAAGSLVAACSVETTADDDEGSGGSSSTTAATGPATATGVTTAVTSVTTGGMQCMLTNIQLNANACGQCAEGQCCAELTACDGNPDCVACLGQNPPAGCDTNPQIQAINTCLDNSCAQECGGQMGTDICGQGVFLTNGMMPLEACNMCVDGACCATMELQNCVADAASGNDAQTCWGCIFDYLGIGMTGGQPMVYDDPACPMALEMYSTPFATCMTTSCSTECGLQ
jgi:hypothetical protein